MQTPTSNGAEAVPMRAPMRRAHKPERPRNLTIANIWRT